MATPSPSWRDELGQFILARTPTPNEQFVNAVDSQRLLLVELDSLASIGSRDYFGKVFETAIPPNGKPLFRHSASEIEKLSHEAHPHHVAYVALGILVAGVVVGVIAYMTLGREHYTATLLLGVMPGLVGALGYWGTHRQYHYGTTTIAGKRVELNTTLNLVPELPLPAVIPDLPGLTASDLAGWITCPRCRGSPVQTHQERCSRCRGSGVIHGVQTPYERKNGIPASQSPCARCHGSGTVTVQWTCPHCALQGRFPVGGWAGQYRNEAAAINRKIPSYLANNRLKQQIREVDDLVQDLDRKIAMWNYRLRQWEGRPTD